MNPWCKANLQFMSNLWIGQYAGKYVAINMSWQHSFLIMLIWWETLGNPKIRKDMASWIGKRSTLKTTLPGAQTSFLWFLWFPPCSVLLVSCQFPPFNSLWWCVKYWVVRSGCRLPWFFPSCMDAQKSDGLRCRKCSDHFQGLKLHLLCNLHLFIVLEDGDEGIMKVAIKSHHIDRPVQDTWCHQRFNHGNGWDLHLHCAGNDTILWLRRKGGCLTGLWEISGKFWTPEMWKFMEILVFPESATRKVESWSSPSIFEDVAS